MSHLRIHRCSDGPWGVALALAAIFLLSLTRVAGQEADRGIIPAAEPSSQASLYGEGIRSAPWRSPQDEKSGFHLPPGFEVRLFASEPQIAKPLNMAFDHRGRMWVTQSVEYPYPVRDGAEASDAVVVLSDTNGDGSANEVTTFADHLNIPIGVLPYGDGCLCFSIPNIWYLRDRDRDGKCDARELILGPFDTTRDTHGMINSLRDGGDGWIYACHGFNNRSEVAGSDGHVVKMSSGNTFRFRPDGSRIEIVTHGQVNPFGMTEDDWGYRYSADCHSKPITQLIRGACYPSFGRPDDGLGFLPPTVDHLHGSTAISGILHISGESPITPLRHQLISGNVMTSRLNRDRLTFHGATAKGQEIGDFLTSDDSWFRPVDLQLGPDGHIYVADFYNKIIGHYEVPLDHPGRDRKSGRIWQIRYTGAAATADTRHPGDAVEDGLRSTNSTRRRLAAQSQSADKQLALAIVLDQDEPAYARVAAARALQLTGSLDAKQLAVLCADDDARLRVEALRLSAERLPISRQIHRIAIASLKDPNAHVAQAAAESLGRCGNENDVKPLFAALARCDQGDVVLRQTIRIAVRNLYRSSSRDSKLWQQPADAEVVSIMLSLQRPEMIPLLLEYLADHPGVTNRDQLLKHAARHATDDTLAQCVSIARRLTQGIDSQLQLLKVLSDSQNVRPGSVPEPLADWAGELVSAELQRFDALSKNTAAVAWTTSDDIPWPQRPRSSSNGKTASFSDSIGRGETYTGILRSDPLVAPSQITFWLAGHNGFPDQEDHRKNKVRLVDAITGETIHEAYPPRSDVAIPIRWDTSSLGGRRVQIECIDGDAGRAYAWLAVGQFEPQWIQNFAPSRSLLNALQWITRMGIDDQETRLLAYLNQGKLSRTLRIEVAQTVASLRHQNESLVVLRFLSRANLLQARADQELIDGVITSTLESDATALSESTQRLAKGLTSSQQREFALAWTQGGADIRALLQMCQDGWISPSVLVDVDVRQSLTPRLSADQVDLLQSLTSGLEGGAEQRELLDRLRQSVRVRKGNRDNGHRVFTKHCAACHQLYGEGTVVGPQLDGAVTRSVERLLEDVVTPDQNVDKAFRSTSFLLDDGRVIVGLVRSESATEISLVESTGKAAAIDSESVERRQDSGRSLMPGNFGELLTGDDFSDLLEYMRKRK